MIARFAAWAMLTFAALCAQPAFGQNCATVSVSPATPTIPAWNPINPALQEATLTATIQRVNSNSRSARLIFLDANSSASPTRVGTSSGPKYQVINTDTGATVSFPQGTSVAGQTVATTNLPNGAGGNSVTVNLKVQILANNSPVEDFVGGTAFSETLNYAIQCFNNSGGPTGVDNLATSNLTASLTIPRLVSITAATPTTLNFGSFTTDNQTGQISVKSTSSLNVSVSTTNGSQMVRSGAVAPYPANSVIPYTLQFNGVTLAPGSPLTNQTRAGVLGSTFPLKLTLVGGLPSGKLAGSYSDTVVVTITPGI